MKEDSSNSQGEYFIDAESPTEMARLMHQDRLVTAGMGGLFPERTNFSTIQTILDIGCGPGGWVLDVAHTYPDRDIVGIDISETMVRYAFAQARAQKLDNVHFEVMDATKPLDFPDASFDLVNTRSIIGFMNKETWPRLVSECMRILRPGGVLRMTEGDDWGTTNSAALEKLCALASQVMQATGQSFSPSGRNFCIVPMLLRFLRDTGYEHIEKRAHIIDFSAGTGSAHEGWYQNCLVAFQLLRPFLMKLGMVTEEEFDTLYLQMQGEMLSDTFCAIYFYATVWGEKPMV